MWQTKPHDNAAHMVPGGTPLQEASPCLVEDPLMNTTLPTPMAAFSALVPVLHTGQRPQTAPCGGAATPPKEITGLLSSVPVLIQGLPNSLCNSACMEVVLENAGLEGSFVGCNARPGETNGEAIVYLKDRSWAEHCVKQFDGRPWDYNIPVKARILEAVQSTPNASPTGQDAAAHVTVASQASIEASTDVLSQVQNGQTQPVPKCQGYSNRADPGSPMPEAGSSQEQRHSVGKISTTPCSTTISSPARSRTFSWADVRDDEKESTCSGTNGGESTTEEGLDMLENGDADESSSKGGLGCDNEHKHIALYVPFAEKDQHGDLIHVSSGLKVSTKRTFIDFSLPDSAGVQTRMRRARSVGITSSCHSTTWKVEFGHLSAQGIISKAEQS